MSVHELASLTTKSRTDSYSDQYNHILVVKILMACSVITGINWYKVNLPGILFLLEHFENKTV